MCNPVVLVLGRTHVGKDTFAQMLRFYNDDYHILKLASQMKRRVEQENNLPYGFVEHRQVKNTPMIPEGKTYGEYMAQRFLEVGHEPKDWLMFDIDLCHNYNLVPVITDCRHPNEYRMLKNKGYFIILVRVYGTRSIPNHPADEFIQSIWNEGLADGLPHMSVWNTAELTGLLWYAEMADRFIQSNRRHNP